MRSSCECGFHLAQAHGTKIVRHFPLVQCCRLGRPVGPFWDTERSSQIRELRHSTTCKCLSFVRRSPMATPVRSYLKLVQVGGRLLQEIVFLPRGGTPLNH